MLPDQSGVGFDSGTPPDSVQSCRVLAVFPLGCGRSGLSGELYRICQATIFFVSRLGAIFGGFTTPSFNGNAWARGKVHLTISVWSSFISGHRNMTVWLWVEARLLQATQASSLKAQFFHHDLPDDQFLSPEGRCEVTEGRARGAKSARSSGPR